MPQTIDVLAGLGKAFSQEQLDRAYYDTLVIDFGTAFTSATESFVRNSTGGFFVITMSMMTAWVPSPSASAINGTPFALEALATKASDTWPTFDFITAKMKINSRQIGQNTGTRAPLMFGLPNNPRYYPYAQPVVEPGETIYVTLTNESAESCKAQVLFEGMVVPR